MLTANLKLLWKTYFPSNAEQHYITNFYETLIIKFNDRNNALYHKLSFCSNLNPQTYALILLKTIYKNIFNSKLQL